MTTREAVAVRTRDEIAHAIRALGPAQWARLRLVAKKYAWLANMEPEDLLQEVFRRALEKDGRQCPTHIDVVKFLAEAMRSIADGEADKLPNKVSIVPVADRPDQDDGAVDPADPRLNAEDIIDSEQTAAAIRCAMLALFSENQQARDLIEGIMEDFSAEELRDLTGLDKTAFASARRLIRRTIDKSYPEGWKP